MIENSIQWFRAQTLEEQGYLPSSADEKLFLYIVTTPIKRKRSPLRYIREVTA